MEALILQHAENDIKIKYDHLTLETSSAKICKYKWSDIWRNIYPKRVILKIDHKDNEKFAVTLLCNCINLHTKMILTIASFKDAKEYAFQSTVTQLALHAENKPYTKKKYTQIWKLVSDADKRCDIWNFMFDSSIKFSKLVNSMRFVKDIFFWSCNFTFQDVLKFKDTPKYALQSMRLQFWTMYSSTFQNLVKILGHVSESASFHIKLISIELLPDSLCLDSLFGKLNITSEFRNQSNRLIQGYCCESSLLQEVAKTL